jgi:hypothetical protein
MELSALEGVPELCRQVRDLHRQVRDAITGLRALLDGRARSAEIVYTADALYRIAAVMEKGAGKITTEVAGLIADHDRQRYKDGWEDGRAALLAEQAAAANLPRLKLAASG